MIGLIQRVTSAQVNVDGTVVAEINQGLVLLLGIQKKDSDNSAEQMLKRVLGFRVFSDESCRMNLSLKDVSGSLLIVSQFTLAADTRKGLRPSFSGAAPPEHAKLLYEYFVERARTSYKNVATGIFGANMQVSFCNDGPVTFMLES
ncbi:MAG: D-tyrosyl-tRNA(Tyr) deacylase [Cellvibrionales bacterium TMED49]|nr:D-tyrosyl-tRNA(Tyr) deacylase [Porticoccaceae bacterium]OUU37202.1 MAG: D-tyrosyl-tRNA(Tyr) deacylase [Cellvibrionales bacterium TMED49]